MLTLNQKNVDTIASFLKGAKRTKFLNSISIINESLNLGTWIPRGRIKALSGFNQIASCDNKKIITCSPEWYASNSLTRLLNHGQWTYRPTTDFCEEGMYGSTYPENEQEYLSLAIKAMRDTEEKFKISDDIIMAYYFLVKERDLAIKFLDDARPLPSYKAHGELSPKVVKTLKECNLNIDVKSIKVADIAFNLVPSMLYDEASKSYKYVIDPLNGSYKIEREYYIKWSEGIKHNTSRFSSSTCCHACGKTIPSRTFVPIEAKDLTSGDLVSMMLGTDCAFNIFRIKDIGIKSKKTKD